MKKPVYLSLSISDMRKIVMYEYWYEYIKPKSDTRQNHATLIQTAFYNSGHNNLELYLILVEIQFTTSKRKLDI